MFSIWREFLVGIVYNIHNYVVISVLSYETKPVECFLLFILLITDLYI